MTATGGGKEGTVDLGITLGSSIIVRSSLQRTQSRENQTERILLSQKVKQCFAQLDQIIGSRLDRCFLFSNVFTYSSLMAWWSTVGRGDRLLRGGGDSGLSRVSADRMRGRRGGLPRSLGSGLAGGSRTRSGGGGGLSGNGSNDPYLGVVASLLVEAFLDFFLETTKHLI